MGKKYIIDLNPDCVEGEYLRIPARIAGEEQWLVTKAALTPYTEPDLGQVRKYAYKIGYEKGYRDGVNRIGDAEDKIRKEAYADGYNAGFGRKIDASYQEGLSDAWEAARKIIHMPEGDLLNIFTECYSAVCTALQVILKYDASEAIEKIRQYEQEKQEKDAEIKVGKELQMGERKCVVTHIIDETQRRVLWDNGVSGLVDNTDLFGNLTPTGRYFPEIAAVLEKMRGEQDE